MRANELNSLIDGCVNQLRRRGGGEIPTVNSVNTYSDAIYVSFRNEQDAIDAANYFNGFKSSDFSIPLVSVYLDRCVAALRFSTADQLAGSPIRADENGIDSSSTTAAAAAMAKRRLRINIECEILVTNRQLK